jgi:hypothetical protein
MLRNWELGPIYNDYRLVDNSYWLIVITKAARRSSCLLKTIVFRVSGSYRGLLILPLSSVPARLR